MKPPIFWWLTKDRRRSHNTLFNEENNNLKRISVLEYSYSFRQQAANLTSLLDNIILSIIWYISTQGQMKNQHSRKMFAFFPYTSWLIDYSYVKMETENLINHVIKSLSLLLLLLSFSLILLFNTASKIN